jgi:hypothetical protein
VLTWPGVPDLKEYAPKLDEYIRWNFDPDENFFVDHPVPGGKAPPDWVISVMHPIPPDAWFK